MAEHPRTGERAPDFRLPASTGGDIGLGDYLGKNDVVLYFYPKDDTPGCTREACGFRDASSRYREHDVAVLGVSPDDVSSHQQFANKFNLQFPLLADTDRSVIERYGAWGERIRDGKSSMGVLRTTFLIGRDGIIKKVYPQVTPDGHADAILADIESLRS